MTVYYFTATGNSLYAARAFPGKHMSVAQAIRRGEFIRSDDVIGIVFPIYGFGAPSIVRRFLTQARWTAQYTFAIGTYGNMPGAAMPRFVKFARKLGIKLDYTDTIKMTDNYLPGFKMEDQLLSLPGKKVEEKISLIAENVRIRHKHLAEAGIFARIATAGIQWFMNTFSGALAKQALKYRVDDGCVKCGMCASVCPTANIVSKGEKPVFGDRCEGCLACVHNCPEGVIHMRGERSAARFRNESVSAADIAAANKQLRGE